MTATSISTHPIHLGLGASAISQPAFTGAMEWYAEYSARHEADGAEGRLISMHTFSEPWEMWEMHPAGSEVVLCVAGTVTLLQEQPEGSVQKVRIAAGEYAINPPGVWHTADAESEATVLFITAGIGTEHRPRE